MKKGKCICFGVNMLLNLLNKKVVCVCVCVCVCILVLRECFCVFL